MSDENGMLKPEEMENALYDHVQDNDTEKYLIFKSGDILYGVCADNVSEILTNTSVTWLPMTPAHVSGVVNLRGQIVPIVDFRLLLGRMPGENYCTIVLNIDETVIGILVDGVDQITDIEKRAILPVPAQQEQKMVLGMCTIPGESRTMMVMDCARLLNG